MADVEAGIAGMDALEIEEPEIEEGPIRTVSKVLLGEDEGNCKRRFRLCLFVLVIVAWSRAADTTISGETAPFQQDAEEEFLPVDNKNFERVSDPDRGWRPDVKENMFAHDIAEDLELYHEICEDDAFIDAGMKIFYTCQHHPEHHLRFQFSEKSFYRKKARAKGRWFTAVAEGGFIDPECNRTVVGTLLERDPKRDDRGIISMKPRKNHTWSYDDYMSVLKCQPKKVKADYVILTTVKEGYSFRLFWHYKLSFRRGRRDLGLYKTDLDINAGQMVLQLPWSECLDPFLCVILLTWVLLVDVLCIVVFFPRNVFRLCCGFRSDAASDFDEHMWNFVDPRRKRKAYVPLAFILLENFIGLLFVYAIADNIFDFCVAESYWDYYTEHVPVEDINDAEEEFINGLPRRRKFARFVTATMWDNQIHAFAIAICFGRLMEISLLFERTSGLLMMLLVSCWPLLHFFMVFYVVLLGFATYTHHVFGSLYCEFYTLPRAQWTLMLYQFGDEGRSMLANHHDMEVRADEALEKVLLVYDILVKIVLMNVFTTIVIEAYMVSIDPERFATWWKDSDNMPLIKFYRKLRRAYARPQAKDDDLDISSQASFVSDIPVMMHPDHPPHWGNQPRHRSVAFLEEPGIRNSGRASNIRSSTRAFLEGSNMYGIPVHGPNSLRVSTAQESGERKSGASSLTSRLSPRPSRLSPRPSAADSRASSGASSGVCSEVSILVKEIQDRLQRLNELGIGV